MAQIVHWVSEAFLSYVSEIRKEDNVGYAH